MWKVSESWVAADRKERLKNELEGRSGKFDIPVDGVPIILSH